MGKVLSIIISLALIEFMIICIAGLINLTGDGRFFIVFHVLNSIYLSTICIIAALGIMIGGIKLAVDLWDS